jgi:thymidylate synthase
MIKKQKLETEIFREILGYVYEFGAISNPRGLKIMELENYNYQLPPYIRFCNFKSRKLNIGYIKKEFLWYLNGDKFDKSICNYAKMWKSLINKDGSINSNYGQYIFGKQQQFRRCLETLIEDKESRRASIVILNKNHLKSKTKDYPCTYAINFRIRGDNLNMSIRMRSQDAIFGMGNDAPNFSFIHEMMYMLLKKTYKKLNYGYYYHSADSFHIYQRHWNMTSDIIFRDKNSIDVKCPKISSYEEAKFLMDNKINKISKNKIPKNYKFCNWLVN